MKLLKALTVGVRTTNKSYRMVALLYATNFALAAILAWGFRSVLIRTMGDSMSLENLVKDFDYTVFTDFMFKYGGRITALISQLSWLIFFYLLINTLLGGGTIALLKNADERFSMSSFFENCGKYFFRFLRLLLIFGIILVLVGIISSMIFGFVYSALTSNAVSEVLPFTLAVVMFLLFLFVVMLIVMMADYAKVATVVNDSNSMLKTSWQGIKIVFRHFLSTFGLQLSIILFLLLAVILYHILEAQIGMTTLFTILVMFLIQQLSVGAKVWTRVLTFAGELELYDIFESEVPTPSTVPLTPELVPIPTEAPAVPKPPPVVQAQLAWKKRVTRRPVVKKVPVQRKKIIKKSK
jgi:hypothetical protein